VRESNPVDQDGRATRRSDLATPRGLLPSPDKTVTFGREQRQLPSRCLPLPNGPRISCGDWPVQTLSALVRMRFLDGARKQELVATDTPKEKGHGQADCHDEPGRPNESPFFASFPQRIHFA
jgi:hypothetical protein